MPNHISGATRALPDHPNLRHLKNQAKDLLKSGGAITLADAQFQIARSYGFTSWPKLKAHVDSLAESEKLKDALKDAIDRNDLRLVQSLMTRNPSLHQAQIGYGNDGPLTWVAECRVPFVAPDRTRLAMARWMIENGSDIHRGGDAPLMRAALNSQRIPMMELLVSLGADVNAAWHGHYPIIFAACEALNPRSLEWLLNHGADPNCGGPAAWQERGVAYPGTALDYALGTYGRHPERLSACIDILLAAQGQSRYESPAVFSVLRGDMDQLSDLLDADPALIHRRFPELDFGTTAARGLTLRGCTLLHIAAEFQRLDAATLLLEKGADSNAKATMDEAGVGGQTPIFHAATQYDDAGLPLVRLLADRGADLTIRAKLPGSYEVPGSTVNCTPLGYAILFPGDQGPTSTYLRERGGVE
jgi:hypothetical protein